jgi:hypothetical protein
MTVKSGTLDNGTPGSPHSYGWADVRRQPFCLGNEPLPCSTSFAIRVMSPFELVLHRMDHGRLPPAVDLSAVSIAITVLRQHQQPAFLPASFRGHPSRPVPLQTVDCSRDMS